MYSMYDRTPNNNNLNLLETGVWVTSTHFIEIRLYNVIKRIKKNVIKKQITNQALLLNNVEIIYLEIINSEIIGNMIPCVDI